MSTSLFIAHGSPMLAIEDNVYTQQLQKLGQSLPKPDAIVIFSAHWVSRELQVSGTEGTHPMIYDFGGFPQALFEVVYPAKGSPQVADKVLQLFKESGIAAQKNIGRGMDHGIWVPLKHLYPDADIPVIGISVNPLLPPKDQYNIGKAVSALLGNNILVIGSGVTVHNFRAIRFESPESMDDWAKEFDDWLISHIREWDTEALFDYLAQAPHAALATPDYEHFLPLFIAMGSGDAARQPKLIHQSYQYGSLSHVIIQFA
jgi:4,5-DOPA dioxygenase extradiol